MVDGPQSRRLPALVEVVLIKNRLYLDIGRSAEGRGRDGDENDRRSTVKCKVASRNLVVPVRNPQHTPTPPSSQGI